MHQSKMSSKVSKSILSLLLLGLVAGCAGMNAGSKTPEEYVEVPNPAFTMYPNAPDTIWVPKSSVDRGVPRGRDLVKQGFEAVAGNGAPAAPAAAGGSVLPMQGGMISTGGSIPPSQAGITAMGGKPVALINRFGLVVAVDGQRVYFNLGREAGLVQGQQLKIYRGGTLVQGLGLAPGELMATVEFQGFVGTGGYGVIKQGGQLRVNDLVGID